LLGLLRLECGGKLGVQQKRQPGYEARQSQGSVRQSIHPVLGRLGYELVMLK
jgi:hypothetical protein